MPLEGRKSGQRGTLEGSEVFWGKSSELIEFFPVFFFPGEVGPLKGIVLDLVKFFVAICVVDVAPVFCAEAETAGLTEMSDGGVRPGGFVVL